LDYSAITGKSRKSLRKRKIDFKHFESFGRVSDNIARKEMSGKFAESCDFPPQKKKEN
jgi:hypothetical protein